MEKLRVKPVPYYPEHTKRQYSFQVKHVQACHLLRRSGEVWRTTQEEVYSQTDWEMGEGIPPVSKGETPVVKAWRKAEDQEKEGLKNLWNQIKARLADLRRAERIRKCRNHKEKARLSFL